MSGMTGHRSTHESQGWQQGSVLGRRLQYKGTVSEEVRTPAPMHRAPVDTWRPVSRLAVGALLASVALAVPAMIGLWLLMAVPLTLGVVALLRVDPALRRGRGMAFWAVGIAAAVGIFSFTAHVGLARSSEAVANNVLAALRSGDAKHVDAQFHAQAREAGTPARVTERYRAAQERFGRYEGIVGSGIPWLGGTAALYAPTGIRQVGDEGDPPGIGGDLWLWARARFERGEVHVAVQIDQDRLADPDGAVGDVRFFAPKD
jgi:hypothetical protein